MPDQAPAPRDHLQPGISVADIARFLDHALFVQRFGDDQGGVYHPSPRHVRRLGLALEPWPGLGSWIKHNQLDALFLHRPWRLSPDQLAPDVGILAYHLAFDERLTLGFNPRLTDVLNLNRVEVLGEKEGRPLGMLGEMPTQTFANLLETTRDMFGGYNEAQPPGDGNVLRIAIVGAMNDALVREAAQRGADVYMTGQFRQPARLAVTQTGLGVIAVGHRRSEEWGLRALAGLLRERWAKLEVAVRTGS